MKKLITIILLLAITGSLFAQTNIYFRDDFDNNNANWSREKNMRVVNGMYTVRCDSGHTFQMAWKDIYIDQTKDFYIEARVKQVYGTENATHGITWGTLSWGESYSFQIAPAGWYYIERYDNKKFSYIKKSVWESAIKKGRVFNTLGIRKKGNNMDFLINGKKVFTTKFLPFKGSYLGFVADKSSKMAADYIVVKHPKIKINLVSKSISKYNKKNMGLNINSPYPEIAPVISPDGNTLYFARSKHPQTTPPKSKYDIWVSHRDANGKWGKAKRLGKPLNNSGDNVVIAVSPDNNTLLLETLYNSDGSYKSDQGISITHKTKSGWSIPRKVVIDDYYNLDQYESFCPTANRQVLIMSVQRKDSYGDKDMYVSFRQANGTYSKPKNMGTDLNSFNQEGTPYIAPDNKTLYFYSYVEPGYGSADIFVTKRLDDTWTKWSKPKNLGKKVNTSDWDVYYTVPAKGDFAYLISSKDSYGAEDIFSIQLEEIEKPDPVVLVKGVVVDKKTQYPISTKIIYENALTGKIEGIANSNPNTGKYQIILPYGVKYEVRAKKKNYFAVSETLDLRKIEEYKEVKKNLIMIPLEKTKTIILKDVHFYAAKDVLIESSYHELNRLAKTLKENPTMVIEIQGHTESTAGYEKKLLALSERRAKRVKQYLIKRGVSQTKIKTKAFGGTKPIATNANEAGRKKNRRVEFKIIHK